MNTRGWLVAGVLALAVAGLVRADARQAGATEAASFAADNAQAMDRMMAAMTVPRTGNVDRDFVETMVPHHQGAIDMALAELRYGKDETLRRMAQEIVVEQRQEIDAMRLAARQLPRAGAATTDPSNVCKSRPASPPSHASAVPESH